MIMDRAAMPDRASEAGTVLGQRPDANAGLICLLEELVCHRPAKPWDDLAVYQSRKGSIVLEPLGYRGDVGGDVYQDPTSRLKKSLIPAALAVIMPFILLFQRSIMAGLALCQPISPGWKSRSWRAP